MLLLELFKFKPQKGKPEIVTSHIALIEDFCERLLKNVTPLGEVVRLALERLLEATNPTKYATSAQDAQKQLNEIRTVADGFLARVLSLSFGVTFLGIAARTCVKMQADS